jgi:hypothetical protein
MLLRINNTLAGRLILGPGLMIAGFLASEPGRFARGERGVRQAWLNHAAGLAVLLVIVRGVMGIDALALWRSSPMAACRSSRSAPIANTSGRAIPTAAR